MYSSVDEQLRPMNLCPRTGLVYFTCKRKETEIHKLSRGIFPRWPIMMKLFRHRVYCNMLYHSLLLGEFWGEITVYSMVWETFYYCINVPVYAVYLYSFIKHTVLFGPLLCPNLSKQDSPLICLKICVQKYRKFPQLSTSFFFWNRRLCHFVFHITFAFALALPQFTHVGSKYKCKKMKFVSFLTLMLVLALALL